MTTPYLMFNQAWNVFEIFSRTEKDSALKLQANSLGKAYGFVCDKNEMAAEARKRSTAVDEALQCVPYLYLEYNNNALTNNS